MDLSYNPIAMGIFNKPDDKAYHVYAGILITALTGFVLYRYVNCTALVSWLVAFFSGIFGGLVKELIDKYIRKKEFSVPDLVATGWGALVGSFILIVIIATL